METNFNEMNSGSNEKEENESCNIFNNYNQKIYSN